MKMLGIETSCDETAVAVIETRDKNQGTSQIRVLSNVISSQVKLHAKYGGVVPNLAAREHVKNIEKVFHLALKKASLPRNLSRLNLDNIDLIAVTRGPGLGPSLLVGIAFARTLAWKYDKPLIGINHLEGHIYSNWLRPVGVESIFHTSYSIFPILNLIVSGGHTELVLMHDHGKYKVIGETLDDAVGEAFDKVARLLGLSYPGGPIVSARASRYKIQDTKYKIQFPRPMINSKNYDFSYAGLKTSVLYKVRDLKNAGVKFTDAVTNQICYEFQKAALDVLIAKTVKASQEYEVKSLFLSGGVSANKELRERLEAEAKKLGVNYSQPEMEYTGDNAAMIAVAGYFNWKRKSPSELKLRRAADFSWKSAEMDANLIL